MTTARPEVPLQVITPNDVRESVRRARKSLVDAANEVVWQIEMEAWRTLGYSSWTAMREAEYGGAAFMVPSKSQPEIVKRIKAIEIGRTARGGAKHLTNQEIADTTGLSERHVRRLLSGDKSGQMSDSVASVDDVIDAEVVDDDEPSTLQPGDTIAEHKTTDPAATEPVAITTTCPTCHGTGKVTR
ncbi:hypothetical protein [Dermacoccus nishinomiyaensis]|uniref:hypothetical protein n=1 Tax=Dermacoccus nishinomiyaensis TaxID=1274 RepID=UPI00248DE089|nr:hypothetical protein [Dermacoccus nishinomiyaensis]